MRKMQDTREFRVLLYINLVQHNRFLADHTNGRAYATVLRLSSVCDVMYCG